MGAQRPVRVLIVRVGAMGDVLHGLPAVTALRRALPECFVGWAIEPRWSALLTTEAAGGTRAGDAGGGSSAPGAHAGVEAQAVFGGDAAWDCRAAERVAGGAV